MASLRISEPRLATKSGVTEDAGLPTSESGYQTWPLAVVFEPWERLWDGVLVDLDLGPVGGVAVAGLGVGDEYLVGLLADQVLLAGDGGGGALQTEQVLVLGVDVVAGPFQAVPEPHRHKDLV